MNTSSIPVDTLLQQVFHYKSTPRRRLDSAWYPKHLESLTQL